MQFAWSLKSPGQSLLAALVGIGVAAASVGELVDTPAAHASIMIALDLPAMVQQADHIAVVDVASVQSAWDDRHERIYSTIELKVVENWKAPSGTGAPADHLTVVQLGGTVGDMRMTVTGMGTFVAGERSLVFLRGPAQRAQVVGMTQGKRTMRYEGTSRSWMVSPPDLRQAKLVPAPPNRSTTTGSVAPTPPISSALPTTSGASTPLSKGTAPPAAAAARRELTLEKMREEIQRLLPAARQ